MKAFRFQEFDLAAKPDWRTILYRWLITACAVFGPFAVALLYTILKAMPALAAFLGAVLACYIPLAFYRRAPRAVVGGDFQVMFAPAARPDRKLLKSLLVKVCVFALYAVVTRYFMQGVL